MKLICVALSWICYGLGDLVSRVMGYWPGERGHPYPIYNRLMQRSEQLQDGDPRGPWHYMKPAGDNDEF